MPLVMLHLVKFRQSGLPVGSHPEWADGHPERQVPSKHPDLPAAHSCREQLVPLERPERLELPEAVEVVVEVRPGCPGRQHYSEEESALPVPDLEAEEEAAGVVFQACSERMQLEPGK